MLAGYTAGVPVAPISVAYSLQSQDFAKLKHIAELLDARPDLRRRHRAVRQGARRDRRQRRNRREPRRRQPRRDAFDDLARTVARSPDGRQSRRRPSAADTISENPVHLGSTGLPKGVINHARHADVEPAAGAADVAVLAEQPLTFVDWLPVESHLRRQTTTSPWCCANAGTLSINAAAARSRNGRRTVRNLSEISPTI
jgi:feruloyl-CoA synthase